jgi:hypothetical protein
MVRVALTGKGPDAAMQPLRYSVVIVMRDIVDRALRTYEFTEELNISQLTYSRYRIELYIDKLMGAGQEDPQRLTEFAVAYLRELYEGPDSRFTGC